MTHNDEDDVDDEKQSLHKGDSNFHLEELNSSKNVKGARLKKGSVEDSQLLFEKEEISDRFNLVYIIFILQGLALFLPYQLFLTAKEYYANYKLVPSAVNATETIYQKNYLAYAGMAGQIPNVVMNIVNLFCHCGGRHVHGGNTRRVVGGQLIQFSLYVVTLVLACVDSSQWTNVFFIITMTTIVLVNCTTGVVSNCLFGLTGNFPPRYINALVLGMASTGFVTGLIMIITKASSPTPRTAAIFYFIASMLLVVIAIVTFLSFPSIKYYRYRVYESPAVTELQVVVKMPYLKVFKKIWIQLFNASITRFISLSIFPYILGNIQRINPEFAVVDNYYTELFGFVLFWFVTASASTLPQHYQWPPMKWLIIVAVGRLVFIPYFMFCNYRPEYRSLPVLLDNDWAVVIGIILFGFSYGYLAGLTMMYCKKAAGENQIYMRIAGMMSSFAQVLGLTLGANFTIFVAWMIENIGK
ncbi:equilibrative nucleoside transporter 3-like isoform X2 [Tubulanus polymorphus]|uniref:equilibrative nucleoside transporter 3-like isoform X2 n=1 Tax=Tubulanus polymorphus TaxID=672921 RepID=UPI003DA5BC4D